MTRQAILTKLRDPNSACRSWTADELAQATGCDPGAIAEALALMVAAGEVMQVDDEYELAPREEVKRPRQMSLLD